MLAEVGKNDKYVGHFPELWFSGFNHSELGEGEKEQRGRLKKETERKIERRENTKEEEEEGEWKEM